MPKPGETVLYALWHPETNEMLKWGIWTYNGRKSSRYKAWQFAITGVRMQILMIFPDKDEALSAERYLVKNAALPWNADDQMYQKGGTQQHWLDALQKVRDQGVRDC
jgi:hypothetical protein